MHVAVDVGGTKTIVAMFSDTGVTLKQQKFETDKDIERFLGRLEKTIKKLASEPFESIVMGLPGPINQQTKTLAKARNLPWKNVDFGKWQAEKYPGVIFAIENDANLGGLGEVVYGNGKTGQRVLYLTIGTGVKSALLVAGQLDAGTINNEVADLIIDRARETNQAGSGTFEALASGSALLRRFGKHGYEINDPAVWREYAEDLAVGLLNIVIVLEPDVAVLGGGIAVHFEQFEAPLRESMKRYYSGFRPLPELRPALRPEGAVIYGCFAKAQELMHGTH